MHPRLLETIRADDISQHTHPTKERCVEYVVEQLRDEFDMSDRAIAAHAAIAYDRMGSFGTYAYWLMFTSNELPARTREAIRNEQYQRKFQERASANFVSRYTKRLLCMGRRDEVIE